MRVYFAIIAAFLCAVAICFALLPVSFLDAFRQQSCNYCEVFGLGETVLPQINCAPRAEGAPQEWQDTRGSENAAENEGQTEEGALPQSADIPFLADCNLCIADCYAEGVFDDDFALAVEAKLRTGCTVDENGMVDYRAFGFTDRMQPIKNQQFNANETVYVLRELISYATALAQAHARLGSVRIEGAGGKGELCGTVTVDLSALKKRALLGWLPQSASFELCVPYAVSRGQVCIISDDIEFYCTTVPLPNNLVMFACSVAFGNKNYRALFGQAFENVFTNLGISQ